MKPSLDNCYSAQERYLAAFGRFFLNIFNLGIFYGTTTKFLGSGESQIEKEWLQATKEGFTSPKHRKIFEKYQVFKDEDFMNGLSTAFAKASTRLSTRAVESTTLVFAHTILDETLSECCRISFIASPKEWFQFVQERKVKLGELEKAKDMRKNKAWEFIGELERESILQRFDFLHKVCAPKMKGKQLPTAWINREQLETFDKLRHRVIHGKRFLRKTPNIEDQIYFAKICGISVLTLVGDTYGLLKNKDLLPRESSCLRMVAVLNQEFPEFVELLEKMVKKRNNGI